MVRQANEDMNRFVATTNEIWATVYVWVFVVNRHFFIMNINGKALINYSACVKKNSKYSMECSQENDGCGIFSRPRDTPFIYQSNLHGFHLAWLTQQGQIIIH
jgi:hypothetical protein